MSKRAVYRTDDYNGHAASFWMTAEDVASRNSLQPDRLEYKLVTSGKRTKDGIIIGDNGITYKLFSDYSVRAITV
jgi:hypothetical protein